MNRSLAIFAYLFASAAVAQNKVKPKTQPMLAATEGSEFSIDPKLVDKFFDKTTRVESTQNQNSASTNRVEVGYGYMVPSNMTLQNKYFEVPYSKNNPSISYGFVQLSKSYATFGSGGLNVLGSVGYSNQQGIYEVKGSSGIDLKDTVSMQWVPIDIGTSVDVRMFNGNLQPALMAGIGADWISQSGTLDGMNQNYWIPHLSAGPAVTFFGRNDFEGGFDGVTLAGIYRSSYSKDQTFKGWSYNLVARFAM